MKKPSIVCIIPPYYRLIESKNNRVSPAMHYAAQTLAQNGFPVTLINGDYADQNTSYCDRYSMYCNNWLFEERYREGFKAFDETVQKALKYNPSIVIIGAGDVLLPTVEMGNGQSCAAIAAGIKRQDRSIKCIGYGHMLKYTAPRYLQELDVIITSECEDILVDVITNKTEGLIHDHWVSNLDCLPILTTDYIAQEINKYDFDYIMSMRGCQYKCRFCLQPGMRKQIGRLSVEHFRNDLLYRIHHLGLTTFYFSDMVFLSKKDPRKKEMLSMLCEIKKAFPSFRWCCEERTDSMSEEDYLLWKMAGCFHIKYGVEALDQKILNALGKHTKFEHAQQAFARSKKAGLQTTAYILLGCPGFTDKDYREMLQLFHELDADNYVVNISVPYCGTQLNQQLQHQLKEGSPYYNSEEGFFHLSDQMSQLWGISPETLRRYFDLRTKKEDRSYRQYTRKIVDPQIYFSEHRIEYME